MELVDESLRRIEAAADLGAVISTRPAAARREAREVDRRVRGDDPLPLCGLPALVKDNEAVAGSRTTYGSRSRRMVSPESRDGLAASVLRSAGAIIVGKTNLPEFAFEGYTDNPLFGPTKNPWRTAWSPGGSSGGSAAALAAGLAPIATATDVGGSVRIPAALCGLIGLKPTAGLVTIDPDLVAPALNAHGPLATTTSDVRLLLDLLVGASPGPVLADQSTSAGRLRLIATERLVDGPPLPQGLSLAFGAAVQRFADAVGGVVEETDWWRIFSGEYDPEDWFRIVAVSQLRSLGGEFLRDQDGIDPVFAEAMRRAATIDTRAYRRAVRRSRGYRDDLDRLLHHDAVLISPTLTVEGWSPEGLLPGHEAIGLPSWVYNTEPANLTGHPALAVPGGLLEDGRPFGLQLVGPRGRDHMLLDLAAVFEGHVAWPLSAPGYRPFTIDTIGGVGRVHRDT